MSKRVKKGLVPELRFPEFANAGEWLVHQLIDVSDKNIKWNFTGGPFGSNLLASDFVSEKQGVRVIQLQNIGDGEFKNDYKIFTSKDKADELISCNIFPGDIIISKMGDPVGRACLIPDIHPRYVMGSDGIRVVVNEGLFDKYFVFSNINSIPFRTLVENKSIGSTRRRIGLDTLRELPFVAPSDLLEQQKIAACLSSVDELLTAEREKLEALRAHKKGLMQQLFPAEGAKVPVWRFPGFRGEWEEKLIEDVCNTFSGGTPLTSRSEYYGGDIPFIRSAEIGAKKTELFLTELGLSSSSAKLVNKGDVLFAMYGANSGDVAIAQLSGAINQAILCIQSESNNEYIYHFLTLKKQWIVTKYIQGGQGNLSGEVVRGIVVPFPHPDEQHEIASCLSSLDTRIALQDERVAILEEHKKGLLQGLFPPVY